MFLRCRKLGQNGRCCLTVIELGQNHFTVDWDIPVDRPQFCIDLEYILAKSWVQGENRIEHHLGAFTTSIAHLALTSIRS
jgi:hypothetical protein